MLTLVKASDHTVVSLEEIKIHLRLDRDDEDNYLSALIRAAESHIEQQIGRSLLFKIWRLLWQETSTFSNFLTKNLKKIPSIKLPNPPLFKIKEVNALVKGEHKKPINYSLLNTKSLIPEIIIKGPFEKVEVIYCSGYSDRPINIPAPLRQAVCMQVADFYEKREITETVKNSTIQNLLQPYRIQEMG